MGLLSEAFRDEPTWGMYSQGGDGSWEAYSRKLKEESEEMQAHEAWAQTDEGKRIVSLQNRFGKFWNEDVHLSDDESYKFPVADVCIIFWNFKYPYSDTAYYWVGYAVVGDNRFPVYSKKCGGDARNWVLDPAEKHRKYALNQEDVAVAQQ